MLTKGDDYPIHQRPEPIAYAGTDRNFYDRYFFNGYSKESEEFFALALGVYPHLNIMDASFCVIKDGIQHNLRASRHMGMERMDTRVGPISVEVLEPLQSLRIVISDNEYEIDADLTFECRAAPLEEPHFSYRMGPRMFIECTRMTQNGCYVGRINVKGTAIDITADKWMGTRDRSWGVRPIGAQDTQPMAPPSDPQYYWLWAPVNFDDCITLYDINTDAEGNPWHHNGVIAPLGGGAPEVMEKVSSQVKFKSGTRHAQSALITFQSKKGEEYQLQIEPLYQFYMSGIGYMHPEWGHGMNKGELALAYDTIDLAAVDEADPLLLHIQAISRVQMGDKKGMGVLEQLIIGPHAPSGFKDILDMAP